MPRRSSPSHVPVDHDMDDNRRLSWFELTPAAVSSDHDRARFGQVQTLRCVGLVMPCFGVDTLLSRVWCVAGLLGPLCSSEGLNPLLNPGCGVQSTCLASWCTVLIDLCKTAG